MKICWDTLEKLYYNKEKGCWYSIKSYTKYTYRDSCKTCGDPFLSGKDTKNLFCCNKCKRKKKGIKLSEEHKRKIGIANLGNKGPLGLKRPLKTRLKMSEWQKGKEFSIEHRNNLSGKNNGNWKGGVTKKNISLYDTYSHQIDWCEETRRDPDNYDWLQVRCTYSECRESESGGWFNPTIKSVKSRIDSLKGINIGECRLYCSVQCKKLCPIYQQHFYYKGDKSYSSRDPDYSIWSKMIKIRDNHECQICGSRENLISHHFEGLQQNDMMSLDLDIGVTLCKVCERRAHSGLGCRYSDMTRQSICGG